VSAAPGAERAVFVCRASPSLALLKYWGKLPGANKLPATPSLALCLGALKTTTIVEASFHGEDGLELDGARQPAARYSDFFDALRRALKSPRGLGLRFRARSRNDFPSSSGLASSSSGFASLAIASARAGEALLGARPLTTSAISRLARRGSVSAARAVFGGFCLLPAGHGEARALFGEDHWPDLRILVAVVSPEEKAVSSRAAMELSRSSSIYHRSWVRAAGFELKGAVEALRRRDLEALGGAMRRSYLRMFGAMLGCEPPLIYWLPGSLAVIRECEAMRREGIGVWETMDAGPQVKMLCLAADLPRIAGRIGATGAAVSLIESGVGAAPEVQAVREGELDRAWSLGS
jgi:diphosphomevalonate decarboxylase